MRTRSIYITSVVALALVQAPLHASTVQPKRTAKAAHAPRAVTSFKMSMIAGARISSDFRGAPIATLVQAIEKLRSMDKGGFETSADFEARKMILTRKLLGGVSLTDTFAFDVPVENGVGKPYTAAYYEYDADSGIANLFFVPSWRSANGIGAHDAYHAEWTDKHMDTISIASGAKSKERYAAANA